MKSMMAPTLRLMSIMLSLCGRAVLDLELCRWSAPDGFEWAGGVGSSPFFRMSRDMDRAGDSLVSSSRSLEYWFLALALL